MSKPHVFVWRRPGVGVTWIDDSAKALSFNGAARCWAQAHIESVQVAGPVFV